MGRTEIPDLKPITSEPWLDRPIFHESEMAHSSECTGQCAPKVLDTADIVREAMLQQQSHSFRFADNSGVGGDKRVYEDLCYCPFANPRSAQWRATELWVGEARAQLCRAAPFASLA